MSELPWGALLSFFSPFRRASCGRHGGEAHQARCSLASPEVLSSKLDETFACWRKKITTAQQSGPDAWKLVNIDIKRTPPPNPERVFGELTPQRHRRETQKAFENVYSSNLWTQGSTAAPAGRAHGRPKAGGIPKSGSGSTLTVTADARAALLKVIRERGIRSIVDAPCGDLTWMPTLFPMLEAMNVSYHGVDVVRSQIRSHQQQYAMPGVRSFSVVDLAVGPLPSADLIFSRQAMQHLHAAEVLKVLGQISRSDAKLMLATTYDVPLTNRRPKPQVLVTLGQRFWAANSDENYMMRPVGAACLLMDLTRAPFDLPQPIAAYKERGPRNRHGFSEYLGLWPLPLVVGANSSACAAGSRAQPATSHTRRPLRMYSTIADVAAHADTAPEQALGARRTLPAGPPARVRTTRVPSTRHTGRGHVDRTTRKAPTVQQESPVAAFFREPFRFFGSRVSAMAH